jgi:hypothetical protein
MPKLFTASASISYDEGFYYLHIIAEGSNYYASYLISEEKAMRLNKNKLMEERWTFVSIGIIMSIPDDLYYLKLIIEEQHQFFFLLSWEEVFKLQNNSDLEIDHRYVPYKGLL